MAAFAAPAIEQPTKHRLVGRCAVEAGHSWAYKSRRYRQTGGLLEDFAEGHSPRVTAKHYPDIDAHRPLHDEAIENDLREALEAALEAPVVLDDLRRRLATSAASSLGGQLGGLRRVPSASPRQTVVAAMASEAGRRAHEVPATGAWAASSTTAVAAAAVSAGVACGRPGGAVTPAVHASVTRR